MLSFLSTFAQRPLITKWKTSTDNYLEKFIKIHAEGDFLYEYQNIANPSIVGNGTGVTGITTINLPFDGEYIITIKPSGDFKFNFQNAYGGDRHKILEIIQWGDINWKNDLSYMFYHCYNLRITANDIPNFSNVTSMKSMFVFAYLETIPNVNNWDTSQVTDMSNMFESSKFNEEISNWNTGKVKNMSGMFKYSDHNKNIGDWNTSQVTDMSEMFYLSRFSQNIGNWNTGNVTNMSAMFRGAFYFNQNIGSWDTSKVKDMSSMFDSTTIFNQDLGNWNTQNVENMYRMFNSAQKFNQNLNNWKTSKVKNMSNLFSGCYYFNGNISNWDTSSVTNMSGLFSGVVGFNQDITNWNTSKVTDMSGMFYYARSFNKNISGWNTDNVTNVSSMFKDASQFNQNIGTWSLKSANNLSEMFNNSGLECGTYGKILKSWSEKTDTPNNITLGATNVKYGKVGQLYRNQLIADKEWNIVEDLYNPLCASELSVTEESSNDRILIYPNPASDKISIETKSSIKSIQLFDSNGKLIKTSLKNTSVDIKDLNIGIYILKIELDNGKISNQKIIKK